MGFEGRFAWGLAWRLLLAVGLLVLLALSFARPGYVAVHLVLALAAAAALCGLWHHVGRTNRALARFVEALRHDDFAQRFSLGRGSGFDELGTALDSAIVELGRRREAAAEEARFLSAVVDDSPVALLMIDQGDRVTLLNKAARRQFGQAPLTRLPAFEIYGSELVAALAIPFTGRRLTRITRDGVAQRAVLEGARLERLGQDIRIVSVLPVQRLLGSAEMAAQSDLVRVLTHEIMNSLTPITSLARSAADLLAAEADPRLADARGAVDIVARRAEGMHRFVESYRAFATAPDVRRRQVEAGPWAAEIARLFAADPAGDGVALVTEAEPATLLDADPELLAQVVINLLRNAASAARAHTAVPGVRLSIRAAGPQSVLIEVADNGPGIPEDRREDIFLPFYTTRREGHGVGLSFVRQVAIAHGATLAVDRAPEGGALIRLLL
jgi:nitrogen fixation/metabolism regulation signal transduction histidine kinase